MALTFFATNADLLEVWRWLFEQPGMMIFETYSAPDQSIQRFSTWLQLESAVRAGHRSLAAWPSDVGAEPELERITFNAATQRRSGASERFALRTPAMIALGRNNDQNGCLASAAISSWTEKGARQRSIYAPELLDQVNWTELRALSKKAERFIRRLSPAKMRAYPIMADAFARFERSEICLWNWGEACTHPSPIVTRSLRPQTVPSAPSSAGPAA